MIEENNDPILSNDDFMQFISKMEQDERVCFANNVKSEKEYYNNIRNSIYKQGISDLELAQCRIQCTEIISIFRSYLSRYDGMYGYATDLNREAVAMYNKSIPDFEQLLKTIVDKIEYRQRKKILKEDEDTKGTPEEIAAKLLTNRLTLERFFDLPKVIELSEESKSNLILNLANPPYKGNRDIVGYKIALLEHLEFIKTLSRTTKITNTERDKRIGEILGHGDTEIKNQINSLNKTFEGNKKRYRAIDFLQPAKEYYEKIK